MNPITAFKAKRKLDKLKSGVQQGSTSIFTFFVIFNFLLVACSIGIIGCSIYLFVITREGNAFNICFLLIGISLMTLSIMAFKLRKSIHLLGCYLVILGVVFFFLLIVTIIMLIKKEVIVNLARQYFNDSGKSTQEIEDWINSMTSSVVSVSTALIFFCCVIFATIIFGYCYRDSTKNNTHEHKQNLIADQKEQEMAEEREKVVIANNQKRDMYEQKYPELAKYRQQQNK
eukprot:403375719